MYKCSSYLSQHGSTCYDLSLHDMTQVSVLLVSISKVDIHTRQNHQCLRNPAKTDRGLLKALAVESVTASHRYPRHLAVCLLMGGKYREILACGSWPDSKVNVFLTCYVTKTLSTFQTTVHQLTIIPLATL